MRAPFTPPVYPWDRLAPYARTARAHPDGLVDLSVGTPVDPTPPVIAAALSDASDAPGYPLTAGTPELRAAAAGWLRRRLGVIGLDPAAVLPTIGSKEFVAMLPTLLGLGPGDRVVHPAVAYPTYDIGARIAGAEPVPSDGLAALGPAPVRLIWINSPANPTGNVLPVAHLRKVVAWARERGAIVASDECYIEFGWDSEPTSVLHPSVCGDSHAGVLAVHSLSKRSNVAGYRAGFVAGDPAVVQRLLTIRRHAGFIVPAPVQAAMTVAYGDDEHVTAQRERYGARRTVLLAALRAFGLRVEHSTAGLYLWATADEDCWSTVGRLAQRGVLVAPGEFYGPAGQRHVRVALTGTDERVAAAAARMIAQ